MPKMHPSYFANSLRKQFRCATMATADELALTGMSALSATSRAMLSGAIVKDQDVSGFHEAVFDRIYFKGRAIKLITARLAKEEEAAGDTTIGAICDLIYLEVSFCSLDSYRHTKIAPGTNREHRGSYNPCERAPKIGCASTETKATAAILFSY